MSAPKFTPGPWGIEDPLGPEIMSIVANPEGETYEWTFVAQVTADDDNTEAQGISFAEAQANAALIRAAPELYTELRHLVRLMEPLEDRGLLNIPGLATLNGARAALKKAEGQQ